MAKPPKFKADTSFDFGANLRPKKRKKAKAKGRKKGKGGGSFGS